MAMETTGHYWLSLYYALTDNDIIDSIIIADYLRVFGSKESKLPEKNLLSLKQLTRFKLNIVDKGFSLKAPACHTKSV